MTFSPLVIIRKYLHLFSLTCHPPLTLSTTTFFSPDSLLPLAYLALSILFYPFIFFTAPNPFLLVLTLQSPPHSLLASLKALYLALSYSLSTLLVLVSLSPTHLFPSIYI